MNGYKMSKNVTNEMKLVIPSLSVNEGLARAAVAAFCARTDPVASELADIRCTVSEAVTNCIVHAYKDSIGPIYITVKLQKNNTVKITVRDRGCGIPDIKQARQPLFTTDSGGERSGMGFTVMESFADKVSVTSKVGVGTVVTLTKKLSGKTNGSEN